MYSYYSETTIYNKPKQLRQRKSKNQKNNNKLKEYSL